MSELPRMRAVPARGAVYHDCTDPRVLAENAAKRAEALSHISKAAHLLGYHPEELDLAREMLPTALREHEVGGFLPSHVAVRLWRRIESLSEMAVLQDTLDRYPDLKRELRRRYQEHSDRMRDVAAKSPKSKSFQNKKRKTG